MPSKASGYSLFAKDVWIQDTVLVATAELNKDTIIQRGLEQLLESVDGCNALMTVLVRVHIDHLK